MTPTGKVSSKQFTPPATKKVVSAPVQQAKTVQSGPPSIYFEVTHDTDERHQTAYNNLRTDFKLQECPKYKFWCKETYVAEPKNELTCNSAIERYGLNKDEVNQRGLLKELCSNSEMKSNASIELPKDYFNMVLEYHRTKAGIPE